MRKLRLGGVAAASGSEDGTFVLVPTPEPWNNQVQVSSGADTGICLFGWVLVFVLVRVPQGNTTDRMYLQLISVFTYTDMSV